MRTGKRNPGDFHDEIRAHLEHETERFREQGLSEEAARSAAQRSFGNITQAEERYYESNRWAWLDLAIANLRFGVRMLRRNPGSSLVAILTLALGIGANTAIFSLLHAALLRDVPVDRPDQLVLFGAGRVTGSTGAFPDGSSQLFSYDMLHRFQRGAEVFTNVAAVDSNLLDTHGRVAGNRELEKIGVELVSGTYFQTLGVNPAVGRVLAAADDVTPGGHPVAVASYAWWRRRLGADPQAAGTVVTIGETSYTIVGVARAGFAGIVNGQAPDLWVPLAMEKEISPSWNGLDNTLFQSLYLFARLKPGISRQGATANVNLLYRQMLRDYAGSAASPTLLEDIGHAKVELVPAARGLSRLRQFTSPLLILMGVAVLVLLIACANVANLLLARSAAREREMAVRLSIGAGRARLLAQLLVESAILGLAGAALSVPAAWGLTQFLLQTAPGASAVAIAPDSQVLGFALAVTLLTVLLFGAAPAIRATHVEPAAALTTRGTATSSRNLLAHGLIAGQIALSLALLAGAGLFLRSLANLKHVDPGFDTEHVLVAGIDPAAAGYREDARLDSMMHAVEARVAAIPGMAGASLAFTAFDGGGWTGPVRVPGRASSDDDPDVFHNLVGADYLNVMRIPVMLGRGLDARDTAASRRVAVINETMARQYFPGRNPIGQTFGHGEDAQWQDIEVVGVVRDGKYMRLNEAPTPAAFYPWAQHRELLSNLVARYRGDPKAAIPQVRQAIAAVDRNLPVDNFASMAELLDRTVEHRRLVALLSSLFGALAALLAAIGIFGVMSYGVSRRTNEFGIRMALGAQRRDVLWMVLRESLAVAAVGLAAGIALAVALSRLVTSMLFGIQPFDPLALGIAAVAMVAVALLAAWLPARGATRIDPIAALRYE